MEALYGWIRSIVGYFLFLGVVEHLIPGKSYEKYFRLFAGMVMILLVIQPLTGGLRLDERMASLYEQQMFQYQAEDLGEELLGMERKRLGQMIERYEEAVEADVCRMASEGEWTVRDCRVEIEGEEGAQQFGRVVRIWMEVSTTKDGADDSTRDRMEEWREGGEGEIGESFSTTDNIEIGNVAEVDVEVERVVMGEYEGEGAKESGRELRRRKERETSAVAKLRRNIASYYDLEEAYVEIQVVQR